MGTYDWLFYELDREETNCGEMLPQYQQYFRGERSIKGAQLYLPYRAFVKPGVVSDEPHFHRDEEYLAFVGHDLRDAFESFDAEIELWMGENYDDMEKLVITKPAMVRVPPFYWHGPIEIKRLGKPLFFQPVLFNGRYYAIKHRKDADGRVFYETVCEGMSPCKRDTSEKCSFCGKCRN